MKNIAVIRRPNFDACRRRGYRRANAYAFPNAAKGGYFLEKLLDIILAAATTVAVVVALMFMFIVF